MFVPLEYHSNWQIFYSYWKNFQTSQFKRLVQSFRKCELLSE